VRSSSKSGSDRPDAGAPLAGGMVGELRVAVVGNPNSGKTTLFNALTGLRQKVGNYPGVTVEKKEGVFRYEGATYRLIDLPGAYSLTAVSDDERVVRDLFLGLLAAEPAADLALIVVDASQLERQLFLATQVMDLGLPAVIALTMNDEARQLGRAVDPAHLTAQLGVPVVEVIAPQQQGIDELRRALHRVRSQTPPPPWSIGEKVLAAVDHLAEHIRVHHDAARPYLRQIAVQLLLYPDYEHPLGSLSGVAALAGELRAGLEASGTPWRDAEARGRYAWIREVVQGARAAARPAYTPSRSDRTDRVVTHPVWGLVIFVLVMAVVFQALFSWAGPIMGWIDTFFSWLGAAVGELLPAGPLRGLLADGVIAGVGGVLVFLPQILLLFFFIAVLEDSGYMARAAFLMNRHMRRAGLHGRAFIPLLSGFACSIPGIMATRTIPDRRDRLVTMLVVPLVSCSARLPVYALMIAAFVPPRALLGQLFNLQGLVLWCAYLFSLAAAITMAFIFRKTILRGQTQPFVMELPPYRVPDWRTVLITMWERGRLFITQAGTIILAMNIVLWFLLSYPTQPAVSQDYAVQRSAARAALSGDELSQRLAALDGQEAADRLRLSYAGRLGHALEPALKPLGFDWKIGIGLIGSLVAREVFVSTMAVVNGIGGSGGQPGTLVDSIRGQYAPLVGITIIIFFVLACQCLATIAITRRESRSWGWAAFLFGYMTLLAYVASLVFYQLTSRLWPELS